MCIEFTKLENKKLRLSLIEGQREELEEIVNNNKSGDFWKLREATEYYWTNGWEVITANQLRMLSDAPVVIYDLCVSNGHVYINGGIWYQRDYAIRSAVETVLENGHIDFDFLADNLVIHNTNNGSYSQEIEL